MNHPPPRVTAMLTTLLSVLLLALPACSPRIQIDVGSGPERKLVATTILADPQPGKAQVAIIDVRGMLADAQRPDLFGQGINPVDRFVTLLSIAEKDNDVRAII